VSDHQPAENSSAQSHSAASAHVSRRAFLWGTAVGVVTGGALAYGGVATALRPRSPASAGSISPLSTADREANVTASPAAEASHPLPNRESTHVELIVSLIRQRYADERLDEAALDAIRDDIAGQLRRSRVLSSFPLENGDRPALVFAPFLADRAKDS